MAAPVAARAQTVIPWPRPATLQWVAVKLLAVQGTGYLAVGTVFREPFSARKFPHSGKSAGKTRAFDGDKIRLQSANPRVQASLPFVLPIYRANSNRELESPYQGISQRSNTALLV